VSAENYCSSDLGGGVSFAECRLVSVPTANPNVIIHVVSLTSFTIVSHIASVGSYQFIIMRLPIQQPVLRIGNVRPSVRPGGDYARFTYN